MGLQPSYMAAGFHEPPVSIAEVIGPEHCMIYIRHAKLAGHLRMVIAKYSRVRRVIVGVDMPDAHCIDLPVHVDAVVVNRKIIVGVSPVLARSISL